MEWINIKENLPLNDGQYLVWCSSPICKNTNITVGEYYTDNKTFYSESDDVIDNVLFWKHIQPPKSTLIQRQQKQIEQMLSSFDEMEPIEQIEFMLNHGREISITFDNDNTSFFFKTEHRTVDDEDLTMFYLKEPIYWRTMPMLFKCLGIDSSLC